MIKPGERVDCCVFARQGSAVSPGRSVIRAVAATAAHIHDDGDYDDHGHTSSCVAPACGVNCDGR